VRTPELLPIPKRLYHYTTQRGLFGILQTRKMFASRIQYLNDSTEFVYTDSLWRKVVGKRLKNPDGTVPTLWRSVLDLHRRFEAMGKIQLYVACFSEDGDALSQWRGYCRNGGYSIGFNTDNLTEAATRQECTIAPCVYDEDKQMAILEELFQRVLMAEGLQEVDGVIDIGSSKKVGNAGSRLLLDYVLLAAVTKHPSFREEREWRIVTEQIHGVHPQVDIREGRTIPIPHFLFELDEETEEGDKPLDTEIVVGPNPEMHLAMESVELLKALTNSVGEIKPSAVPFREL
jgi:hypothetical protein